MATNKDDKAMAYLNDMYKPIVDYTAKSNLLRTVVQTEHMKGESITAQSKTERLEGSFDAYNAQARASGQPTMESSERARRLLFQME